jgi:hypothetical protein
MSGHAGDAATRAHPSPYRPPVGSGPAASTLAEYDASPQPETPRQMPRCTLSVLQDGDRGHFNP